MVEEFLISKELYDKIKTGQITEIGVNGYNGYKYIYRLIEIKKDGRAYKLEGNN